jgi:hypothetical protein
MIVLPPPPPDAHVIEKLRLISETDRFNHFYDDTIIALSASPPFPVYLTPVERVQAGQLLAPARINTWQYFISRNDTVIALAEAMKSEGAPDLAYVGSYSAAYAASLLGELSRAEQVGSDGTYELRVLIVPGLLFRTIWLHATDTDRLLPIPPTPVDFGPNPVLSEPQMIAILRPLAGARLQSSSNEHPA